ncbi:MAG: hypothetical protein MHPSP_000075 [Paramarteilia canceri]
MRPRKVTSEEHEAKNQDNPSPIDINIPESKVDQAKGTPCDVDFCPHTPNSVVKVLMYSQDMPVMTPSSMMSLPEKNLTPSPGSKSADTNFGDDSESGNKIFGKSSSNKRKILKKKLGVRAIQKPAFLIDDHILIQIMVANIQCMVCQKSTVNSNRQYGLKCHCCGLQIHENCRENLKVVKDGVTKNLYPCSNHYKQYFNQYMANKPKPIETDKDMNLIISDTIKSKKSEHSETEIDQTNNSKKNIKKDLELKKILTLNNCGNHAFRKMVRNEDTRYSVMKCCVCYININLLSETVLKCPVCCSICHSNCFKMIQDSPCLPYKSCFGIIISFESIEDNRNDSMFISKLNIKTLLSRLELSNTEIPAILKIMTENFDDRSKEIIKSHQFLLNSKIISLDMDLELNQSTFRMVEMSKRAKFLIFCIEVEQLDMKRYLSFEMTEIGGRNFGGIYGLIKEPEGIFYTGLMPNFDDIASTFSHKWLSSIKTSSSDSDDDESSYIESFSMIKISKEDAKKAIKIQPEKDIEDVIFGPRININHFKNFQLLGQGAYGMVWQSETDLETADKKKYFAIKVLEKSARKIQKEILNEAQLNKLISYEKCEYVVEFLSCFQVNFV